jgi:hypothetical protein
VIAPLVIVVTSCLGNNTIPVETRTQKADMTIGTLSYGGGANPAYGSWFVRASVRFLIVAHHHIISTTELSYSIN